LTSFAEVAHGVYVLRYPVLDVNITLVVGDGAALVVDTLSGPAQASELVAAIRRITPAPLTLVNTHHHFDHSFGNGTLAAAGAGPIWAHEWAAAQLRERGEHWRRLWYDQVRPTDPQLAADLAATEIVAPDHLVHTEAILAVGGRTVRLRHFGRGHTEGDLVVLVPDADVLVAGDLVEVGAPPDFADGYPLDWPDTLAALLPALSTDTVVVPGHGDLVDRDYVRSQHGELSQLDWAIRDGHRDGALAETVAAKAPYDLATALVAVKRGYAELSGRA
jgi:glyoxylase-like metal-dependent hydrolase (beta-lactamase superfamily II)